MKKRIGTKVLRCLGIIGLLCAGEILISEQNCCFAAEIPSYFTKEAIIAEGIEDENFATAIYESVAAQIEKDAYLIQAGWSVREILENYSNDNLEEGSAIINASNRRIHSIEGITLLRNCSEIRLSKNQIHDITPLERDKINPNHKLYFNTTNILIDGGNFQNIIPAELIGTWNGNITVDSTMTFEPVQLNYVYDGNPQEVNLDFGLQLHGAEGGIFNEAYSAAETINEAGAQWEKYADYTNRYTGTRITLPGKDGALRIVANANESMNPLLPATVHYWSDNNVDRKLNLVWRYPFLATFYRTVKQEYTMEFRGGVRLKKRNPEGKGLKEAVYELYRIVGSRRYRYPNDQTSFTTDKNGELIISELPIGEYQLKEVSAPEGYQLDSLPLTIHIKAPENISIPERITGGEKEITISESGAEYAPQWNSVKHRRADGRTVIQHLMVRKNGVDRLVRAEDYSADCFIRNGGNEITILKGELPEDVGYHVGDETKIVLYSGETMLGTYTDAAHAKAALNALIKANGMTEHTGNIKITASYVYEQDAEQFAEVEQINYPKTPPTKPVVPEQPQEPQKPKDSPHPTPIPIEKMKRIRVEKYWEGEEQPEKAFFRPILLLPDNSYRVLGKVKKVSEKSEWKAEWSFQEIQNMHIGNRVSASTSNAGKGTASNATGSNAVLYDEDGLLLDGLIADDLTRGVFVEEINIPEGWEVLYSEARREADGTAVFSVKNRRKKKIPTTGYSSDHLFIKYNTQHRGSGGGDSQTEGTSEIETPKISEPEPPLQEKIESIREISRKKVGLPWGRIGQGKEDQKSGLPKTGEERGIADFLVSGALIWSVVVLLYLIFGEIRRDKGIERKRGE